MGDRVGLILCRYRLFGPRGELSRSEQLGFLNRQKDAPPVAYRKAEPTTEDFDTYIMRPHGRSVAGVECMVWDVVRDLRFRQVIKADRRRQTVTAEFEATDEAELARVVAVPELGALAVEDNTGQGKLGGWPAIKRFQAIVRSTPDLEFEVEPAGSPQDLEHAVRTWDLDQFSFQVRPFNPHPENPGELLSELLANDEVGEFRGVALPREGSNIRPHDEGIVREAMGLAEHGYGTFGAKGRTPSGAEAVIKKQTFSHDREKNLERLRGPQQVRVYVDAERDADRVAQTVHIIMEFFGREVERRR